MHKYTTVAVRCPAVMLWKSVLCLPMHSVSMVDMIEAHEILAVTFRFLALGHRLSFRHLLYHHRAYS